LIVNQVNKADQSSLSNSFYKVNKDLEGGFEMGRDMNVIEVGS